MNIFFENRLVYDDLPSGPKAPENPQESEREIPKKPEVGPSARSRAMGDSLGEDLASKESPENKSSFDAFMARFEKGDAKSREDFSDWAKSQADAELLRRGNVDSKTNTQDVLEKHVRLSSEYLQKMPNENGHFVFSVNFKGNEVAEWKVGAGHLLPPVVKAIKVYDGKTVVSENAVRGIKDGRVGYFDASTGGYVAIHTGYKIEVLEIQEPVNEEVKNRVQEENNLFDKDAKKVAIKEALGKFFSVNGKILPVKVDDAYFVGKLEGILAQLDKETPDWFGKFTDAEFKTFFEKIFTPKDITFLQNLCRLRELRGIQQVDKTFERVQMDVTMSDFERLKMNPKFSEFSERVLTDDDLYDFVQKGNDEQEEYSKTTLDGKEVGANETFVSSTDHFGNTFYLRASAMAAFKRAMQIAEENVPPVRLKVTSSHRSIAKQEGIFKEACAKYGSPEAARKWAAIPGSSPHHTGGAIDVAAIVNGKGGVKDDNQKYLKSILPRAGFVNYSPEPWHWEIYTKRWKGLTGASGPVYASRLAAIGKGDAIAYDDYVKGETATA